ncbi:VOC family protein [Candidatus Poribacteria bacterium]|nr:VOC family protein [Candidatus Poribacteria bacterium]
MITGLAHVCFTVSDLEKSIDYYQNKLGFSHAFSFINEEGKKFGVYLHIGGRNFIELFQGNLDDSAKGQSYRHICLEVDDIDITVKELKSRGVEVSDPKMGSDHSWQAWLTDPDSNRIELHQYTSKSKQNVALK